MTKRLLCCFLCLILLAACHSAKRQGAASQTAQISAVQMEQRPILPDDAEPAQDVKTVIVPAQSSPAPSSQDQNPSAPQTQPPHGQDALDETNSVDAHHPAPSVQEEKTLSPAEDKAVFEGEKLIDFEGRMLHPYAAYAPDASAPQNAPWAYEQLKYGVYYTFIKAGTAYIRNRGLVNIDGRKAYLLQTTAFSAPVIDAFFKVRDINQSWLDAEDFYSLGYGQSVREGGYKRDEWIIFDYENGLYTGKIQKKEEPRNIQGPLEMGILDILTSLYHVRSQQLNAGEDIVFDIINREKQYPLVVKVLGKEKVKTDAGTFDCIVVEPQFRGEGIFVSKGKSLKVWLTDDAYKMPVKMQVEVFIGSVSAKLLDYKRQAPENIL